jgi:hypothetical protein
VRRPLEAEKSLFDLCAKKSFQAVELAAAQHFLEKFAERFPSKQVKRLSLQRFCAVSLVTFWSDDFCTRSLSEELPQWVLDEGRNCIVRFRRAWETGAVQHKVKVKGALRRRARGPEEILSESRFAHFNSVGRSPSPAPCPLWWTEVGLRAAFPLWWTGAGDRGAAANASRAIRGRGNLSKMQFAFFFHCSVSWW